VEVYKCMCVCANCGLWPCIYRVAESFFKQKEIESEAKRLQAATARYQQQTLQWLTLVNELNTALKVGLQSKA
jgi:hypothetical protein